MSFGFLKKIILGMFFLLLNVGVLSACLPNSPICHESSSVQKISSIENNVNSDASNACQFICICSMSCLYTIPVSKTEIVLKDHFYIQKLTFLYQFNTPEIYSNQLDRPPIA